MPAATWCASRQCTRPGPWLLLGRGQVVARPPWPPPPLAAGVEASGTAGCGIFRPPLLARRPWQRIQKTCAAAFSSRCLFFACRAKLTLARRTLWSSACFISRHVSLFVDLIVFISIFNKTNANTNPSSSFSASMQNWNYPVFSISLFFDVDVFLIFARLG